MDNNVVHQLAAAIQALATVARAPPAVLLHQPMSPHMREMCWTSHPTWERGCFMMAVWHSLTGESGRYYMQGAQLPMEIFPLPWAP